MSDLTSFAPAKVNLCLHVTGRRADGYHLLDTLVAFAGVGDDLTMRPGPLSLTIDGPEGAGLDAGPDNLILKAANMIGAEATLHLVKRLPVASGIGGGSSDAAAALRGLAAMTGAPLPTRPEDLGADVPMCLAATPLRATGIGEALTPLPPLPPAWMVLVNPRVSVSTPQVFAALDRRDNAVVEPLPHGWADAHALAAYLARQRNDMEPAATALCPAITTVLSALRGTDGCLLARMSGSGATCFGLYASQTAATAAAAALTRPKWWVAAAPVLDSAPQVRRATT